MPASHPYRERTLTLAAALYVLVLSLFLRLPFFFPIVIDWDESTHVLMGQSVLDGHLPYTEAWDNKPPLVSFFFAAVIALFGKSIIAVRFAGMLCVAASGLLAYVIARRLWSPQAGVVAATLCITLSCGLASGQATMAEHIALAPLLGGLAILTGGTLSPRTLFLSGLAMGIAVMVRTNLAYAALVLGLCAVVLAPVGTSRPVRALLLCGAAYGSGVLLPIVALFLPYAVTGHAQLWWVSVVSAPLSYASSQLSAGSCMRIHVSGILRALRSPRLPYGAAAWCVWGAGLAGIAALAGQAAKAAPLLRRNLLLLIAAAAGSVLSVVQSGGAFGHYLLQVAPFFALTAAGLFALLPPRLGRWLAPALLCGILAHPAASVMSGYAALRSGVLTGAPLVNGAACDVAQYLRKECAPGDTLYMLTDHIVYWLIDVKLPSKTVTHPSNVAKPYLVAAVSGPGATARTELESIMARTPRFVVMERRTPYLRPDTEAGRYLNECLKADYTLVAKIRGRRIFRSNASLSGSATGPGTGTP